MRFFLPILGLVALAWGVQQPLSASSYDAGLFSPFEDLHALSASEYTTLRHPNFPAHSVRIKDSQFCDGDVRWVVCLTCVLLTFEAETRLRCCVFTVLTQDI